MVKRALAGILLACLAGPLAAEEYRWFAESAFAEDSDALRQRTLYAGFQRRLPLPGRPSFAALRAGYREIESPQGRERFNALRLDLRAEPTSATSLSVRLSPLFGPGWSPALAATSLSWRPARRWYLEASTERELVDTVAAIRERNLVDTAALSADYRLFEPLTVVAAGFRQSLRDGNERTGRVGKLILSPPQADWFNLQLRTRRVDSDFRGTGYFSPRRLEEYDLLIGVAGAPLSDRWSLGLTAGGGRQRIDGDVSNAIFSAELKARGWFSDHYGLEARAGCANTGRLAAQPAEDGYRHCSANLNLIGSW
ncbi:MAG: hypothetical protein HYV18_07700 [Gammaproteobacteria bacterium]|nr:hypothetical protein [Gammaproteobacteria bacterium]